MSFLIRQIHGTSNDRDALKTLLYHAIHVAPGAEPPPLQIIEQPELARYVEGFGSHEGDIGVVAVDGDTIIGGAWVRLIEGYGFVDPETPELSISLLPGYRDQGIGTQLMTALFDITDKPYPQISLSVSTDNPALRLYERFGFVIVKQDNGTYTMLRST